MKELVEVWFSVAPWWEVCLVIMVTFVLGVTLVYGIIDWYFTNYVELCEDMEKACDRLDKVYRKTVHSGEIRKARMDAEEREWADKVRRHKADKVPAFYDVIWCELNGHAPWEDGWCE